MTSRRLVLWRHGRTEWNAASRFQGQIDVPLDDVGRDQARRAAGLLAHLQPSLIVSSDLSRARETAGFLAEVTGLDVVVDPAVRETYAGQWQGLHRPEIIEQFGASWRAWSDGDDSVRPGGDGETRVEVAARVVAAVGRHLEGVGDDQTMIVVTHGGAARAAIGQLMGLPPAHWAGLGVLANCAWTVLHERPVSVSDGPVGGPVSVSDGPVGGPVSGSDGPSRSLWRLVEYNAGSLPQPALGDDR